MTTKNDVQALTEIGQQVNHEEGEDMETVVLDNVRNVEKGEKPPDQHG